MLSEPDTFDDNCWGKVMDSIYRELVKADFKIFVCPICEYPQEKNSPNES